MHGFQSYFVAEEAYVLIPFPTPSLKCPCKLSVETHHIAAIYRETGLGMCGHAGFSLQPALRALRASTASPVIQILATSEATHKCVLQSDCPDLLLCCSIFLYKDFFVFV